MSTRRCLAWYVVFHGCVYGVFEAVPVSQEGSFVRVRREKVSPVIRKVMCYFVHVGSRVEEDGSASLFLSGRSKVSVNQYHVMVTKSWDNLRVCYI